MRVEFKPSFERSIKSLPGVEKEEIKKVAIQLVDVLSQDQAIHQGLGLKRLRGDYWEVRKGIKVRILFRWQSHLLEFVLAGDHEDVRRFLKGI